MNLQIARGYGPSKQLGLLQVVGASRSKIFERLMSESVLFAILSRLAALVIVEVTLVVIGRTIAVSLEWADVMQPSAAVRWIASSLRSSQ